MNRQREDLELFGLEPCSNFECIRQAVPALPTQLIALVLHSSSISAETAPLKREPPNFAALYAQDRGQRFFLKDK